MDEDPIPAVEPKELTLEQTMKSQINNPELSDCVFLVGERRTRIYAHKGLLAMSNPIFKSMFFGQLKEKLEIEVPDLHEKGFLNLISYLYTKQIPEDFDLSDLSSTVAAANKYLAFEFTERLFEFISKFCDDFEPFMSCKMCLIYDQLLKLQLDDKSLIRRAERAIQKAEEMIKTHQIIFSDASVTRIDQQTLENILRFDQLYASEFVLLRVCLDWTDAELKRRGRKATAENKRLLFADFKHLIRFGDLRTDQLALANIEEYLESNEAISVLLHSADKSKPLVIDYRSPRLSFRRLTAEIDMFYIGQVLPKNTVFQSECKLRVNKKAFLVQIETQPILIDCRSVVCEIFQDNKSLATWQCPFDQARSTFSLMSTDPIFLASSRIELKPGSEYKFCFKSTKPLKERGILFQSEELTARSEDDEFIFKMTGPLHCIANIVFYPVLLHGITRG